MLKFLLSGSIYPFMCLDEAGGDGAAGAGGSGGGQSSGGEGGGDTGKQGESKFNVSVSDSTQGDQQNSAGAKVSFGSGDGGEGSGETKVDFNALMGDYAEDPAFEAFKTEDGFDVQKIAKAYKDTKSLVGQKLGIPGEDSSDEAKAEFYKALGVPEEGTTEAYGLRTEAPENWPEGVTYDNEMGGKFAEKAKELNLTPDQAKGLQEWYDGMTVETLGELGSDTSKSEEEFDKLATDMLGDNKEAALKEANVLLQKHVPEELRKDLNDNAPNAVLLAMVAAINGQTKEMTGEDRAIIGDGASTGESEQQLKEKARKLMQDPVYSNPLKDPARHDAMKKEVREIFQRIEQVRKAG